MDTSNNSNFWEEAKNLKFDQTSERVVERRLLAVATSCNPNDLLPVGLYNVIGNSEALVEAILLETLSPVPIFSTAIDPSTINHFCNAIDALQTQSPIELRFIIAEDVVEYGGIVTQHRFSFGSVGSILPTVLKACFTLPQDSSWISESAHKRIGVNLGNQRTPEEVNGTSFFSFQPSCT